MNNSTSTLPSHNANEPSLKALEAAAMSMIAAVLAKDPGKKPSMEAIEIVVKLLALRAKRQGEQRPENVMRPD